MKLEDIMEMIELDPEGYKAAGENDDCITENFDLTGKVVE